MGRDDLPVQAQQVYENLRRALVAGGATFADVVKLTTYIVGYAPEQRAILNDVRSRYVNGEVLGVTGGKPLVQGQGELHGGGVVHRNHRGEHSGGAELPECGDQAQQLVGSC